MCLLYLLVHLFPQRLKKLKTGIDVNVSLQNALSKGGFGKVEIISLYVQSN